MSRELQGDLFEGRDGFGAEDKVDLQDEIYFDKSTNKTFANSRHGHASIARATSFSYADAARQSGTPPRSAVIERKRNANKQSSARKRNAYKQSSARREHGI